MVTVTITATITIITITIILVTTICTREKSRTNPSGVQRSRSSTPRKDTQE
jgi:hypothetical protein